MSVIKIFIHDDADEVLVTWPNGKCEFMGPWSFLKLQISAWWNGWSFEYNGKLLHTRLGKESQ